MQVIQPVAYASPTGLVAVDVPTGRAATWRGTDRDGYALVNLNDVEPVLPQTRAPRSHGYRGSGHCACRW